MTRTQLCGRADAKLRLDHARQFLEVARVVQDDAMEASLNVTAALCVLAGIAAADAACCLALGERARGQDHREAEHVVARVPVVGADMAKSLRRLLAVKDEAQYGMLTLSSRRTATTLRHAEHLVDLAEQALLRG